MLKQSHHQSRILFLKLFTQELLINSRLKIEFIEPEVVEEKIEEKEEREEAKEELIPSIMQPIPEKKEHAPVISPIKIKKLTKKPFLKPLIKPLETFKPLASIPLQKITQPRTTISLVSLPEREVDLGSLNIFLLDRTVTEIECPGPGKFILVRKAGEVNLTKLTLSQEEIKNIINNFSEKARIPVISGIFKASVGGLTIIAVISEFVGSRFIIQKASPYSLLDQQTQRLQQAQLQAQLMHKSLRGMHRF